MRIVRIPSSTSFLDALCEKLGYKTFLSMNLHFLHSRTLILTRKWELRCPETHQRKHVKPSALDPFDLSGQMGVSKDFQTKESFWYVSISLAIIWNMMSPFFDEVPGSKSGLASHASKRKLITSKRGSKQTPTTWLCKEIIWLAMICNPCFCPQYQNFPRSPVMISYFTPELFDCCTGRMQKGSFRNSLSPQIWWPQSYFAIPGW